MSVQRSKASEAAHRRTVVNQQRRTEQVELTIAEGLQFEWVTTISEDEWQTYSTAIRVVRESGVRFMLGGGFALAAFTGRWRDTKDIDFYVKPADQKTAVAALEKAGFEDFFQRLPYDRKWIHRNVKSDVIVDIIWSMANQRAQVDDIWFERATEVSLRNEKLLLVPREEFMWCKLYIMQRDHCDWTDLMNLLYASKGRLDWDHVIKRLGEDVPLLRAMLTVYGWLCPREVLNLPRTLWTRLDLPVPTAPQREPCFDRIRLLDSRAWFAALKRPGEKLEV